MPTEILKLKVNDAGQVILPTDDSEGRKAFFTEFFKTPTGQRFRPFVSESAEERIGQVVEKWFGDAEITIAQLSNVVEQLLAVKDPAVVPPPPDPVEVVADDRERNPDGRFKNAFQIFSETHSAFECAEYARQNAEYADWRRGQMQAEGIRDGAFRIAGAPEREPTLADHQVLGEFVSLYRSVPANQLKPRSGRINLDATHSYTPQQFEEFMVRASQAGLL